MSGLSPNDAAIDERRRRLILYFRIGAFHPEKSRVSK